MSKSLRILVIDDNKDIHADFRKVFAFAANTQKDELRDLQADFFDDDVPPAPQQPDRPQIVIDSAYQGKEGIELAIEAARSGQPHVMAFVDVRMPPGIDGVQTIKQLWSQLPELNCVLCTAFSDYDWDEIRRELACSNNLLILKKPFDPIEVLQLVESVAEKVELAQASREYRAKLESQIEELTLAQQELRAAYEQLEIARAQAESAAEAKGQFLANMSHELRTPLNGVIAMTDMLLYTKLDAQQEKYVRTAKSSGETLLELINDILDFSRIESGKLELEQIEFLLHREIEAVITVAARRCQEKGLELACFIDPNALLQVRGDPARMRQVLTNLTTNAVKFTGEGEVVIEIAVEREDEQYVWLHFSVTDTGIGIPADRHERLFNSFSQVDASTTRKYGGTGLGLAISHQLCGLMGGKIGFESTPGQGSTFWFVLPFQRVDQGRASLIPSAFRDQRIMLVDDNPKIREVLERQLRAWGLLVESARDLSQAAEQLRSARSEGEPFAAVLLEREYLGSDPEKFGDASRAVGGLAETPVVVLLPLGQPGGITDFERCGIAGIVNKPIVPSELFNVLIHLNEQPAVPTPQTAVRKPGRTGGKIPVPKTRYESAKILLAEDNPVNQKVAGQILSCFGYSYDVVSNGKDAVAAVQQGVYDLVLMDCQMPEMDGLEATRVIRQEGGKTSRHRDLPIIALTANALEGDRARCLDAGMSDYLSKPLRPDQLLDMIERYLHEVMHLDEKTSEPGPMSQETPSAAFSELPVLDLPSFIDRCMGDTEFADQLLSEFKGQIPQELARLDELIAVNDDVELARLAHTLKGLAANISAEALRHAAFELEEAARTNNSTQVRHCAANVREQWARLEVEVDSR